MLTINFVDGHWLNPKVALISPECSNFGSVCCKWFWSYILFSSRKPCTFWLLSVRVGHSKLMRVIYYLKVMSPACAIFHSCFSDCKMFVWMKCLLYVFCVCLHVAKHHIVTIYCWSRWFLCMSNSCTDINICVDWRFWCILNMWTKELRINQDWCKVMLTVPLKEDLHSGYLDGWCDKPMQSPSWHKIWYSTSPCWHCPDL